ncbi:MAG: hypothetical protein RIS85_1932, partial [Pseudomonadota bacterium]
RSEMTAVAPDQQDVIFTIAKQCSKACAIYCHGLCIKAALGFFGKHSGVRLTMDARIAAKVHALGQPRKKQDRKK